MTETSIRTTFDKNNLGHFDRAALGLSINIGRGYFTILVLITSILLLI